MSRDLVIGDEVILKGVGERYSLSKDGSIGRIVKFLSEDFISIKFELLTGDIKKQSTGSIYTVMARFVYPLSNKCALERKINFMWNRQPYITGNKHHE